MKTDQAAEKNTGQQNWNQQDLEEVGLANTQQPVEDQRTDLLHSLSKALVPLGLEEGIVEEDIVEEEVVEEEEEEVAVATKRQEVEVEEEEEGEEAEVKGGHKGTEMMELDSFRLDAAPWLAARADQSHISSRGHR